jgi:hypothetical protein
MAKDDKSPAEGEDKAADETGAEDTGLKYEEGKTSDDNQSGQKDRTEDASDKKSDDTGSDDVADEESDDKGEGEDKDGKKDDGKDDDKKDDDKKDDDKSDVEAYDIKAPEGTEIDKALLDKYSPRFREANLTNEQVQEAINVYAEARQEAADAAAKEWGETIVGWDKAAREDKDMGGDKWDATMANVDLAFKDNTTPALVDALNQFGMGNHPELIRFAANAGAVVAERNALKEQVAKLNKELGREDDVFKGKSHANEAPVEDRLYGATTPAARRR